MPELPCDGHIPEKTCKESPQRPTTNNHKSTTEEELQTFDGIKTNGNKNSTNTLETEHKEIPFMALMRKERLSLEPDDSPCNQEVFKSNLVEMFLKLSFAISGKIVVECD